MLFADFLDYLKDKQELESRRQNKIDVYNEVANVLWYSVLCDKVFPDNMDKLMECTTPFRLYDWGTSTMRFGVVPVLDSPELVRKFQAFARNTLRSRGYKVKRVRVYNDGILVSF